jgi:hypothetical protein
MIRFFCFVLFKLMIKVLKIAQLSMNFMFLDPISPSFKDNSYFKFFYET